MDMLNRELRLAPPKALYFIIFTISGFSGLIYESIWTHYLKLFLGHAAYAQSLVLSIFMGGMALGAWLAGHYSSRWRTPLLAYAIVEAVIGMLALIFHNSFVAITDVAYTSILPAAGSIALAHALKWSIAALMIIPQSILLGMTFPLMTAGIIRRYPANSGANLSLLYFTNSIGAAIGVLTSGFWLIKVVGLPGTIMTAGLINILLALAVWMSVKLDTAPVTAPLKGTSTAVSSGKLLLVAAFVTGMASFIYEIGWIRMLSLVLGSSTHAFELMLSAFITGLACGGLWIRKRIDAFPSPVRFAAYVQVAMGLLALLTLPLYGFSFEWMRKLMEALARTDESYMLLLLASHSIVLIIMLPATFCAGMTLPLFTHALMKTGYGEKSIGQIYASNTFGSIMGVLFAINMLPVLGLEYLIGTGAALDMALGIALLLFITNSDKAKLSPAITWSATGVLLGLILFNVSDITAEKLSSGVFRYKRTGLPEGNMVYYYRDGKTASISLYGSKDQSLTVATNGKPDASIKYDPVKSASGADESTMTLAGALPFGYKPDATMAAIIGLGSGMTTHTVLALPQLTQVNTIEIEPSVIEASLHFGYKVSRAHTDPRSIIHIEDAKTFFSLDDIRYDIIISEPSNPWVSGVSSLYTTEFYSHVKRSLKEDGILLQWIHLYENNMLLLGSILNAIGANFSDYVLYFANDADILIVSRNTGELGTLNTDFLLGDAGLKKELERIHVRTEDDLRYRLIAKKEHLAPIFRQSGIPVNSDYFPYLDLNAHRAFFIDNAIKEFRIDNTVFPVVEMLMYNRENKASRKLTETPVLQASIVHKIAKETAHWMTDSGIETASFAQLPHDTRNEILAIRSTSTQCNRFPYDAQFLSNLHSLARTMIAGLDKESASAALRTGTVAACMRIAKPELSSWIAFYQATAERDFAHVIRSAETLFMHNDFSNNKPLLAYLLTATLVAYHHTGTPEAARSLWEAHEGTFESAAEVPFHLKLAAHLAYEQSAQ